MSLAQVISLADTGRMLSNFDRSSAAPIEAQVLAEANPRRMSDVNASLDAAGRQSIGASDAAFGVYERQLRALGGQQTEAAARSARRRIGLSRALLNVDARNRAVQGIRSRTDIARTAASDLRSALEHTGASAQAQAANLATDREAQYQEELARYRASKSQGLGQLAGIGLGFLPGGGLASSFLGRQ